MSTHRGPSLHIPDYDHSKTAAHMSPETLPSQIYTVKGQYIWDSWIVEDEGILHRYALSASIEYIPNERHQHAFVRHAISQDNGLSWIDKGPVITPESNGEWPDLVIWTSSILLRKDGNGKKEFFMFITGRNKEDGWGQRIGLVRSADGYQFGPPEQLLSPAEVFNYDITDDDGIIMAWRDPQVIQEKKTGIWHMFFSAKKKEPDGSVRPTVGHATTTDDSFSNWELQPPLNLPHYYQQLEVPYMIHRNGKYYLFVSTQNHPLKEDNKDKQADYRGYMSDNITGPWEAVYGHKDKIYGHKIYAPTIFEFPRGSSEYAAVSFFSGDTPYPLTGTPIVPIEWDGDCPEFMFRKTLHQYLFPD